MTGHVAICLATFRRPQVVATLASLDRLDWPTGVTGEVIVVDNDDTPSAQIRIAAFAARATIVVRYAHAPARNISVARNAALHLAQDADFIAFLDDDEVASPGWIAALLARMHETGADAVLGPVQAVYDSAAPAWMRRGRVHDTRPTTLGNGDIVTGYTCNALLRQSSEAVRGLRFDPARGRSGGEDTAFFAALHAAGGRIVAAPQAVLSEEVPPARARLGWLLRRRCRMGQTHGSLIGAGARPIRRGLLGLAALGKVAACGGLALLGLPDALRRNRALMRAVLHCGTLAGLCGLAPLQLYGGATATPAKLSMIQQAGRRF